MDWNYLANRAGDTVSTAAGYNFRLLLRWLMYKTLNTA